MLSVSRRSLTVSLITCNKYRYGPQDCIPKRPPRTDQQHKAFNLRARGENHGMRTSAIEISRRDFLQRGVAQDDFATMKGQFGIVALTGIRLNHQHMKQMALKINQFLNNNENAQMDETKSTAKNTIQKRCGNSG